MSPPQTEIAVAVGLLIFIMFPLATAFHAAQRDHPGLAVLTFVTTFAGLGPLVGMLTILRVKDKI